MPRGGPTKSTSLVVGQGGCSVTHPLLGAQKLATRTQNLKQTEGRPLRREAELLADLGTSCHQGAALSLLALCKWLGLVLFC